MSDATLEARQLLGFAAGALGEEDQDLASIERVDDRRECRLRTAPIPGDENRAQHVSGNEADEAAAAEMIGGGYRPDPPQLAQPEQAHQCKGVEMRIVIGDYERGTAARDAIRMHEVQAQQ
jgi:hypothetical protein